MNDDGPRTCLVTGGNRGIGLAVARALRAAGERVAITYRGEPPGGEIADDLLAVRCDVRSPDDVDECFDGVEAALGPVEVLVCSAGITDDALLLRMTEERWSSVLDTNLSGAFRTVRRALPGMVKARRGRIVLIGSVVGMLGNAGQTNYSASKAGLIGFARALAREVASRGITVNVVAPGLIDTDMTKALTDDQRAALAKSVPTGRLGTAEEVASAITYLASRDAAYVTGSVCAVDGGLGMGY